MLAYCKWTWNVPNIAPDTFLILLCDICKPANYSEAEISSGSNSSSSNSVLDKLFLAVYLLKPFTTDFSHLLSA